MKRLCMFIICIVLTSTSVFAETEPKPEKNQESAIVHIYRPARIVGFGWNFKLEVKDEKSTRVKNGKHLMLKFAPGKTAFKMKGQSIEIKLEPGKHYYLRASLTRNMFLGKPELVEVTERQATKEIAKL